MKLTPEAQIEQLRSLQKHKGWQLLRSVMEEEIGIVLQRHARPNTLSEPYMEDVMNHQRGMLYAAQQFINLPDRLILGLENHIKLATPPAKQGKSNVKSAK